MEFLNRHSDSIGIALIGLNILFGHIAIAAILAVVMALTWQL